MKSFGTAAVALTFATAGCTITATDHEHHDQARPVVVDNSSSSSSSDSGYYDNNGGGRQRQDPPRHHEQPREQPRENVVWYRELPDRGQLDNYLPQGFAGDVILEPGVYHVRGGEIKFRNVQGGLRITGSGTGNTIIDGSINCKGDNFVFKDFGVTGNFYLRGADCQVHIYVEGFKDVDGPRLNQKWHSRPVASNNNPPPRPQPAPQPQPQPRPQPAPQPAPQPVKQPPVVANNGKLPNKGLLDNYLPQGFKGEVFLEAGIYKLRDGKIKFGGGGLIIHGAGIENTYIEGDMIFIGDSYVMDQLTIKGDVEVKGNSNNFGNTVIRGKKNFKGGNNSHP